MRLSFKEKNEGKKCERREMRKATRNSETGTMG